MRGTWYSERRLLRGLEKVWARAEGLTSRLTGTAFNPLYHLGTLAVMLLIILALTGGYLTLFYRPGAERAYETVAALNASWFGHLMRSLHRYAANALVIVTLAHAFKMLIGDRFWGARWLAWVSGWISLVLIFIIGVMGYWLVWDETAQWLTEFSINLLGGRVALAFYQPGAVEQNFAFFVIILFLHVFMGILLLGWLLIHVIRLSRPALLEPRWLGIALTLSLTILALVRPVPLGNPADFSRLVSNVPIDWLYLGFLPAAQRTSPSMVIGLSLVSLLFLIALPWLWRGRITGPAVITEHLCTGCALCALKCPYEAIDMEPRSGDASGFKALAVVTESLCTGCGLCVGTCATVGVDLQPLPTRTVLQALQEAIQAHESPIVVVTCQRQAVLGTVPHEWRPPLTAPPDTLLPPPVQVRPFTHNNTTVSVITCVLPCTGMFNPDWARTLFDLGMQALLILSCPADDCNYREGPFWLGENLRLRKRLLENPIYWTTTAPGRPHTLTEMLERIIEEQAALPAPEKRLPRVVLDRATRNKLWLPPFRSFVPALVMLLVLLAFTFVFEHPTTAVAPETATLRLVLEHTPPLKANNTTTAPLQATLPAGVSAEQILGGERHPVRLRLDIDGQTILDKTYAPSGIHKDGEVIVVEQLSLTPGAHTVHIWLMDDEQTWRYEAEKRIDIQPLQVVTLTFDEEAAAFVFTLPHQ
ncbi:4Fe-4S dicluster domain-containing protein [Ardenticatena maritima]|uniref:Hydrogenase iron-sulfur subunit n=1 Tax=Ardenticatena maritima TaxID=872965 RepID=A0A0P6XVQ4_9CHLR|nr:4Fe-4S dicluster domain-containing protein [Ardenticatena maritima]KPL87676.1 hypothetical protein SE16_08695 [Ardenticatena maritima]